MNGLAINNIQHFGEASKSFFVGSFLASIFAVSLVLFFVFLIGVYIYFALAWSTIAKKLKYKYPWLAWIPVANISLILSLGGFHWAWVLLLLVPVFGWVALLILAVIATWKIFEKRKYPGWLSLALLVPKVGMLLHAVIIGFVAWKEK